MLADRGADGRQVANPATFPGGWPPVTAAIHALGMKSGLYTSKSLLTCQKLNASCGKETIDAQAYAEWQIDYVKEDSCGPCRNNDTLDYVTMAAALKATGRDIILTDEGGPDNAACSAQGVCGNAKRVGHDIQPAWLSMISLVDIGSGLWPYAHNESLNGQGWCECPPPLPHLRASAAACASPRRRARSHFSRPSLARAPPHAGNDLDVSRTRAPSQLRAPLRLLPPLPPHHPPRPARPPSHPRARRCSRWVTRPTLSAAPTRPRWRAAARTLRSGAS